MATPRLTDVISHWSKLFENFETSVSDFYVAVRAGVSAREIPGIHVSDVTLREAGPGSASRAYLRIERDELAFDVCAAPFGKGFFFSWWLSERRFRFGWVYLITLLLISYITTLGYFDSKGVSGRELADISIVTHLRFTAQWFVRYLVVLVILAGLRVRFAENIILALPLFGNLFRWAFKPLTYYRLDTIAMYQASVKGAVEDAIDDLTKTKGLRALTDDERKPVMREFYKR